MTIIFGPLSDPLTSNEWYTPAYLAHAARRTMGEIDLDPATSEFAQKTIKAKQFFTKEDNGLNRFWHGKVWLNPPYREITPWIMKLIDEYFYGRTTEAILLVNAYTESRWFQHLWQFPLCFTRGRINFYNPTKGQSGPCSSSAIAYMGPNIDRFADHFRRYGRIMVSYDGELVQSMKTKLNGKGNSRITPPKANLVVQPRSKKRVIGMGH